jgi:hypothetical protein
MERADRDDRDDEDDWDVGIETCPSCGSMYEVTINQGERRAHDWYNCVVCGRMLMEWDSSETPCFTLIGARFLRKPR